MKLFHFSDNPGIDVFVPRPVLIPAKRRPGQEWLNSPLIWAIDQTHDFLYLFPRQCPRILIWPTENTSEADRKEWFGDRGLRAIAFIEKRWVSQLTTDTIYRYELPIDLFEALFDAGMWVSRQSVSPICMDRITRLDRQLEQRNVQIRAMDSLVPLKGLWSKTFHASGIRLRNAEGWASSA